MKPLFVLVAAIAFLSGPDSINGAERPNIVMILADDLGYGSVGCYGADERLIQTPSIDRLAREGRRFTDANAPSSVCSPTRYALLTGRYCWRSRLNHGEVLGTFEPLLIEPERPTIASMLKKHGYRTGFVGKWHLGYGTADRVDYTKELKPGPLELGFDYQFAVPQNHNDLTRVFVENHAVFGLRSAQLTPSERNLGLDAPQRDDARTMEQLTDRAVAWLEKQITHDEPFFLYFSPVAVHERITPSADAQGTSKAGPYGDFIHDLDRSVDRILKALARLNVTDQTLVIFTSDNGGVVAQKSKSGSQSIAMDAGLAINGSWRGGKHDVWEGGFRVPFVVRWPGHVPAGTTCGEMISLVDLYATLASVVGEPLPEPDEAAPDSYNILPAIIGAPHPKPIRRHMILHSASGVYAIRQGPWKWIEGRPSRSVAEKHPRRDQFRAQLINLQIDPGETADVGRQHPAVARRLSKSLDEQRENGASREAVAMPGEASEPDLVTFQTQVASQIENKPQRPQRSPRKTERATRNG
jgi:arylsulfatase A-like enzyme